MKGILQLISLAGLLLTVVPAFLVFSGSMTWNQHALFMLIGTIVWFASAPFWMKDKETQHAE